MPPQLVWPCGQEQTPAAQEVPTGQVRPQTPQLVGSVCRSRQKPLQTVWPVGHCGWQAPLTQSRPEPQRKVLAATLQPPQLFGSLFRSRQKPPQFVWPTGQLSEQVLPTQLVPPGQTLPQAPQLFGLLTRLTQLRPGRIGLALRTDARATRTEGAGRADTPTSTAVAGVDRQVAAGAKVRAAVGLAGRTERHAVAGPTTGGGGITDAAAGAAVGVVGIQVAADAVARRLADRTPRRARHALAVDADVETRAARAA